MNSTVLIWESGCSSCSVKIWMFGMIGKSIGRSGKRQQKMIVMLCCTTSSHSMNRSAFAHQGLSRWSEKTWVVLKDWRKVNSAVSTQQKIEFNVISVGLSLMMFLKSASTISPVSCINLSVHRAHSCVSRVSQKDFLNKKALVHRKNKKCQKCIRNWTLTLDFVPILAWSFAEPNVLVKVSVFNLIRKTTDLIDMQTDHIVYCYGEWQEAFSEL